MRCMESKLSLCSMEAHICNTGEMINNNLVDRLSLFLNCCNDCTTCVKKDCLNSTVRVLINMVIISPSGSSVLLIKALKFLVNSSLAIFLVRRSRPCNFCACSKSTLRSSASPVTKRRSARFPDAFRLMWPPLCNVLNKKSLS